MHKGFNDDVAYGGCTSVGNTIYLVFLGNVLLGYCFMGFFFGMWERGDVVSWVGGV